MRTTFATFTLALCATAAYSQATLSVPPDVGATHGSASAVASPLRFCTWDDASPLRSTASAATVRLAWTIAETPPGLSRTVAITTVDAPGCVPVQALPAGGVDAIQTGTPYVIVDKASDWSAGYTALVMASKRDEFTNEAYAARLKRHVKLVTSLFESKGMDGYIVDAGPTHEWAYLHWIDLDTAKRAFATTDGMTGPKDSLSIQRPIPQTVLSLP